MATRAVKKEKVEVEVKQVEQEAPLLDFSDLQVGQVVEFQKSGQVDGVGGRISAVGSVYVRPSTKALITEVLPSNYARVITPVGDKLFYFSRSEENKEVAKLLEGEETTAFVEQVKKYFFSRVPKMCAGTTTGSDPELFALSADGKVIPAFTFLPNKAGRVGSARPFWDGFQGEFNPPASYCHQVLASSIRDGMTQLLTAAKKIDPKARLTAKSVVEVGLDFLKTLPDEFIQLGCASSTNAYGEDRPESLDDPRQVPFRSAGCHMHFSATVAERQQAKETVKLMDAIAGVSMVSLFDGMEDSRRRLLYGRAGEYRLPTHGIEWRVPPAEVLCHPAICHLCFDLARQAKGLVKYPPFSSEWDAKEEETREIINNCDVVGARKVLKKNKSLLLALYKPITGVTKEFETLVFTGCRNWLPTEDLIGSWALDKSEYDNNQARQMSTVAKAMRKQPQQPSAAAE